MSTLLSLILAALPMIGQLADRSSGSSSEYFADTAGVRRFDLLEQAVKRAGAARYYLAPMGPGYIPLLSLRRSRHCIYLHPRKN